MAQLDFARIGQSSDHRIAPPMGAVKVLLVDDHSIVRIGLRRVLNASGKIEVIGEAGDGETAYREYGKLQPDVCIVDLSMPGMGGIETIRRLTARYPDARVLAYSMHREPTYVERAIEAGAKGYCSKDSLPAVMMDAVYSVAQGRYYVAPELAQAMVTARVGGAGADSFGELTTREFEVVELMTRGNSPREIADHLSLSYKSVANYISRIKQKLGVTSNSRLIRMALDSGVGA